MNLGRCPGCGGMFPDIEGPTHRYMESSPGCWAVYGEVLARQFSDAKYASAGQMTIDAYALQHPGQPSPQSIQSIALHLISLCVMLERNVNPGVVIGRLQASAKNKAKFVWLRPPLTLGSITIADVSAAQTSAEHYELVHHWALSAWVAWRTHHATIRAWIDETT